MSRKNPKRNDYYAAASADDRFGMVYEGMVTCSRYKGLSLGAKQFYTLCRVQANSKIGKACLYKHAETEGKQYAEGCFVFPSTHQNRFGVNRQNGSRYFRELINAGFIKLIEQNRHRHKPNVYQFSGKWRSD